MPEPGMFATAIARQYAGDEWEVNYACDVTRTMMETASRLLRDHGYDPPTELPLHPEDVQSVAYDVVVTFCESSIQICPTFSGLPARFHWPLDHLVDCGGNPTIECMVELLQHLEDRVKAVFEYNALAVVTQLRETFMTLIDHLTDGVFALDQERRVFVFNSAVEEITGYSSSEVIGRDCQVLFPELSGTVREALKEEATTSMLRHPVRFVAKDGAMLDLEVSAIPVRTPDRRAAGTLVILRDLTEVNRLRRSLQKSKGLHGIIGRSEKMARVFQSIQELAPETVPVLVQGESGTGKELVAEALHRLGPRRDKPFVPVNTGALPETIIESELFGHVRGAFTGAVRDKKGRFELADGGTLFLDEIGEISLPIQVKLLRVLEEKAFTPVGGEKPIRIDVRVVCATNRNLKEMVDTGRFREDLYYRLAVVPIDLPPLRERRDDIPLLVEHFMEQFTNETGRRSAGIGDDALDLLVHHSWPGNVRQLANAVQYALIKCRGGRIERGHLPPELLNGVPQIPSRQAGRPQKLNPKEVEEALRKNHGNRAQAARDLGVARSTLYRYLEELAED